MGGAKAGGWRSIRSMAMRPAEGYGGIISSGRPTKGAGASRSAIGGGGERAGIRWEEMTPRFLSVRIPRASPCNAFPKYRNLEASARTKWNIIVNGELSV